jgi:FtsH-binding integral membrane protein
MDPLLSALLIPAVVIFVVYRQMMTRPTARNGIVYVSAALVALGLLTGGLIDTTQLALSLALVAVEAIAAVVFGAVRAATVRVWMDEAGVTWSKATPLTLLAWLASVASRVGLYFAGTALGLGVSTSGILFFVGLTIGAQALLVARRGRALSGTTLRADNFVE